MRAYSQFIVWLLLLLMPLQVLAASHMTICNSMMQMTAAAEYAVAQMPCHKATDDASAGMQDQNTADTETVSKSYCASMCASLNVLSMLQNHLSLMDGLVSSSIFSKLYQSYTSVVQSNLLRPPIFLI